MSPWEEVEKDPEFSTLAPQDKAALFDDWHKSTVEEFHKDLDPDQIDSAGMRGFLASGQAKRRELLGEPVAPEQAVKEFDQSLQARSKAQQQALNDYDELEKARFALKDAGLTQQFMSGFGESEAGSAPQEATENKQKEIEAIRSRITPELEKQAKEAREALRGERPAAVLGSDIYTDPSLVLDKEKYRQAIQSTDASPEAKLLALADYNTRRDDFAKKALNTFNTAGEAPKPYFFGAEKVLPEMTSFAKWESEQPPEVRSKRPEDKALDYLRTMQGRPGFQKIVSAIGTGTMQGGADVASQGIGLAAMTTGSDALAKKAGEVEKGSQLMSEVQNLEGDTKGTDVFDVGGVKANAATTLGGLSRLGVGMAPAIGAGVLTGGSLPAAALAAGAQTAGAQFPTTYNAMIEQGKTPEEALSASRGAAVLSGGITAALTALGGYNGVEALVRRGGMEAARSKLKSVLLTGPLKEIAEELPDEQASQIIESSLTNPDKPVSQVVDEFMAKAPDLALQVGLLGGAGEAFSKQGTVPAVPTPAEQQRTPVNSAGLGRTVGEVVAEADALKAKAQQQAVESGSPLLAQAIAENVAAPTPEAQTEETGETAEPSETQEPGAAGQTTEPLSDTEVKATNDQISPTNETPTNQDNATQQEPIQEGVLQERQNRDQSREKTEAGRSDSVQRSAQGQEEVAPTNITNNVALVEQGHVDQHAGESRTPAEGSISDVTTGKMADNKPLSTIDPSVQGVVTLQPEQLAALTPNPAEIEQAIQDNQTPARESMDLNKAGPILVIRQKDGTLKVAQGHHRLARALRDNVPLRVDIQNEATAKPLKSIPDRIKESSLSPRTTYPTLVQDIKNLTGNTASKLQEVADALLPEPMARPTAEKIARRLMEDNAVQREAGAARERAIERKLIGEEKAQRGDERPVSDDKAPVTQGDFVTWQDENGAMREGVLTKASAGRGSLGEPMSEVTLEDSQVVQVPRRELQPLMASSRGNPVQASRAEAIESLRGHLGKEVSVGVSAVDAINGAAELQGDVPGVQKAWVGTSDEFLADEGLRKAFPQVNKAMTSPDSSRFEGLFSGGRAFVFTDNVGIYEGDIELAAQEGMPPGQAAVQRVITHEALVHRGFYALDKPTRQALLRWGEQNIYEGEMDAKAEEYGVGANWRSDVGSREWLMEEIMAKMIERLKAPPKSGPLKQLWDILASLWRKLTGRSREVTLKDIHDVAKLLRTALELAENNVQTRDGMPIRVEVVKPSMAGERGALDAEYMAAVESGDVAKQQAMVDAAAKAAMPDSVVHERMLSSKERRQDKPLLKTYHGTDQEFNTFESGRPTADDWGFFGTIETNRHGSFFAENKTFAETYAKARQGKRVISVFLNIKNPFQFTDAQDILESREFGEEMTADFHMARWLMSLKHQWEAFDGREGVEFTNWLRSKGYDGAFIQEDGHGLVDAEEVQDVWVALDPNQIKSADPITRDANGNVIPLSQRFNTESNDIRFSVRPTYTSPLDQTLANTAKAVRLMRDGPPAVPVNLQEVYQKAQVGKSSAMVSLDDMFAEAKKTHPDLTEAEFGQQVQAMYDDNGAYIEPADSPTAMREAGEKYNVRTQGVPASYVMVLDGAPPNASFRPEVAEKLKRVVEVAQTASGGITESEQPQTQSPAGVNPVHTFTQQSGESHVDAAVQIFDAMESEGVSKEEWVDEITSPAVIRQLGIDNDMMSVLLAEAMRRDAPGAFSAYEVTRERAGRALGSGAMIHNHPRYQHLFVLNGIKKEHQQQANDIAEANADIKTDEVKKIVAESGRTADQELADDAMEAAFREGEEALNKENKTLWSNLKDWITEIGVILQIKAARKAKADKNAAKPSASLAGVVSQARYEELNNLSDDQLDALFAKRQNDISAAAKKMLGKGPKAKANPDARRIATLVNRLSEQLGVPTDITSAVEALTASQDSLKSQFEQSIVDSLVGKVRSAITPKKAPSKNLNSVIKQITRILADNLNLPKATGPTESLGEKAIDAFGRVRNNEQLIREAWEKAREQIRATLAKRATEGLEGLTEEEAADIEQQLDDQLAAIAAEVPAHLWARGQAFSVLRDALAETAFDNNEKIMDNPEGALRAAQGKINEAVEKVGNVDPARWVSNQPYIIAAFNQLVADLRAAKVRSNARRRAAQRAGVFSPAVTQTFNRLLDIARKRSGDKTPLLPENISWGKLFSSSPQSQEAKAKSMMEYMKADPVLSNLTAAEQQELADMFAKQWEAKRTALTEAKVAAVLKRRHATAKGKEAVKGAIPKFIQAINRGELNNDIIAQDIAEKFGFQKLTDDENKKLETLAKELQQPDIPVHERRAKTDEIVKIIARKTGLSTAEILSAWWVTSVLSGPRTIFTIGMAFLSGGFEVFTHAMATVINAHLQGRRSEGTDAAMQSITNYFKSYPRAVQLAWQYVRTGDKNLLADSDPAFMQFFDTGRNNPQSIGWRMTQSKNPATRTLGRFMHFFEKMLTAGDLFNSTITRHGMLPVAQFLNSKTYEKARVASETDLANYRKKALNTWWGDEEPKTWQQQALVTRQAIDLMEAVLSKYANVLEDANFVAAQGAMTLNPEGLGGGIYNIIRGASNRAESFSAKYVKYTGNLKAEKEGLVKMKAQQAIAVLTHFATHQMLNVVGLRFARFGSNKLNQTLGFIPLLGLARLFEKDYAGQVKNQAIIKNQVISAAIAMAGIVILKAIADEPDDDKRGWGWQGSWAGLTSAKIKQLMAAGLKPNSISFNGHVFNYANWPVSSLFAAIGAMADRIKYDPEDWKKTTDSEIVATVAWAAGSSFADTTALSQLMEIFGSNIHSHDPVDASIKKVSKVLGNYTGGFIPRIFKEVDLGAFGTYGGTVGSGKLRKYEGWENFAKEIPIYRRYVGGPLLDIFGKQVEVSRTPWSREYQAQPEAREYRLLGQLGSNGLWLTPADPANRRVGRGKRSREMTDAEQKRFVTFVGNNYRDLVLKHGERLTKMPHENAKELMGKLSAAARDRAERAALVAPATQP